MMISQGMPALSGVTVRTQNVFAIAHELTAELGHAEVTPLHFLLAVLREGRSPAIVALYNRGVRLTELEEDLKKLLPAHGTSYEPRYAWTASELEMLQRAGREARELGHEYRGCEHILLAMLRDAESAPARVLERHAIRFADGQAEVLRILGSPRNPGGNAPPPAA